jgi:hypothetical protein
MSSKRKLLRSKLKAKTSGSKIKFAEAWLRLQVKKYGFDRAWAMHYMGCCNPSKITGQLRRKALGI